MCATSPKCILPDESLHELNLSLLKRVTYRELALKFDLSLMTVYRHFHKHLLPELLTMLDEHDTLLDIGLMSSERLIHDLGRARVRAQEISEDDDAGTRDQLGGIKVLHSISRTGLELSGHLSRGNIQRVQIVNSTAVETEIAPTIDKIMAALAAYPEAALAVANALSLAPPVEDAGLEALPAAE
jgi:hypothetical protein